MLLDFLKSVFIRINLRLLALAAVTAVILLGAGCANLTQSNRELTAADRLASEKRYPEAISAYRSIIRNNSNSNAAAEARIRLAHALIAHDNPQPDYGRALQEFEEFLRLYPDHEKAEEAKNWRQVLRTLERLSKNIEELKRLDIRHEEKRKRR